MTLSQVLRNGVLAHWDFRSGQLRLSWQVLSVTGYLRPVTTG
jgi:hypothetical protein